MKITRTIANYEVKAYKVDFKNGQPVAELVGECVARGTSLTDTQARRALINAGYSVPKGCKLDIVKVDETVWACELEEFLAVAHPVRSNVVEL